jgi:hypothetical protein
VADGGEDDVGGIALVALEIAAAKRDGLGLHGGVDRDPLEVLRAQRAGLVRDPQTLGQ